MGWLALAASIGFNAVAQVMVKMGADRLVEIRADGVVAKATAVILDAPHVLAGMALYAVSFVFWTFALTRHELSFAYPIVAIGYALVTFLSWAVLHENVTPMRVAGTLVICAGVALVART